MIIFSSINVGKRITWRDWEGNTREGIVIAKTSLGGVQRIILDDEGRRDEIQIEDIVEIN